MRRLGNHQEMKDRQVGNGGNAFQGRKTKPKRNYNWLTMEQYSGGADFDQLFWNRQDFSQVPGISDSNTFGKSDMIMSGPTP